MTPGQLSRYPTFRDSIEIMMLAIKYLEKV